MGNAKEEQEEKDIDRAPQGNNKQEHAIKQHYTAPIALKRKNDPFSFPASLCYERTVGLKELGDLAYCRKNTELKRGSVHHESKLPQKHRSRSTE